MNLSIRTTTSVLATLALSAGLFAGCGKKDSAPASEAPAPADTASSDSRPAVESAADPSAQSAADRELAQYSGTLPCAEADCDVVYTTLVLFVAADDSPTTYLMRENFQGGEKSAEPVESTGRWTRQVGTSELVDAKLLVLDPDQPQRRRSYLELDDVQIQLLDQDQRLVATEAELILRRRQAP